MPRMSKQRKQEWSLFLNERNRITYNGLCRKCRNDCKQSFRCLLILGIASNPPFLPKIEKPQRRYIKPYLCHFSGRKSGKISFLSLAKNCKVFVLTCGCV